MRKPLFNYFRPLIFASKTNQQTMFFQSRFLDLIFLTLFRFVLNNGRFWDPLENPVGAKMTPKFHFFQYKSCYFYDDKTVCVLTLFSRNNSNYCAVGAPWLLKGHLFDGEWLICCFGCVYLCSVLYNMFITCFHKTSVNAQPLSPLFFEEIAAHKKRCVFSCLCLR